MILGVVIYFIVNSISFLQGWKTLMKDGVETLQPIMIFLMLYLSLCRVDFSKMHIRRWHIEMIAIQSSMFLLLAGFHSLVSSNWISLVLQSAMLCIVCPTATAATVVVAKLRGEVNSVVTYVCLINIVSTILISSVLPFMQLNDKVQNMEFSESILTILFKVFSTLILPLFSAWFTKRYLPNLLKWLVKYPNAPFYLWAIALCLSIALTTNVLINSNESVFIMISISLISLLCCLFQFWLGRKIGVRYDKLMYKDTQGRYCISSAQCLGQKNTIFAIWVGLTFMNPLTAMAGGFYAIWHNIFNSIQLAKSDV